MNAIRPEPGEVVVVETGTGNFTQIVRAGRHELTADEPTAVGGDDRGPGPYDYLLASLGACTAMTVRMVARRRNLPLTRVGVRLRHARQQEHAADAALCEDRPARLEEVQVELILEGPLDESQRAFLRGIAEKCPVHRTLETGVDLTTRLDLRGQ